MFYLVSCDTILFCSVTSDGDGSVFENSFTTSTDDLTSKLITDEENLYDNLPSTRGILLLVHCTRELLVYPHFT